MKQISSNGKGAQSVLARAISELLRGSGLYTLEEWGEILGVSQPAISQWLHDKTLPRPELLRMIRRVVGNDQKVSQQILFSFDTLLSRPAKEISPHAAKIGETLAHYLLRPEWDAFERCVRPLTAEDQSTVLRDASGHAQRLAEKAEETENSIIHETSVMHSLDDSVTTRLSTEDVQQLKFEEADPNPNIWGLAGHRQQQLLQPHGLQLITGTAAPRFEVLSGLFAVDKRQHTSFEEDVFNFAALPWVIPNEPMSFDGFVCDEMQLVVLRGTVDILFEGTDTQSSIVTGQPHAPGLIRMISPPQWEFGLPPLRINSTTEDPAFALAIFYARSGLNLSRSDQGQIHSSSRLEVMLETRKWRAEDVEQFWTELEAWKGVLPLRSTIPDSKDELDRILRENPLSEEERVGKHHSSRNSGQVLDCNWEDWFHGISVGAIDRDLGALHTRLLKFPAIPGLREEAVCGDAHEGSEIIIPLHGAFNYLYAKLENVERDSGFKNFATPAKRRERSGKPLELWRGSAQSAMVSGQQFSDIVFVDSAAYHGFHGLGENAYCLHIRCLAEPSALLKNKRSTRKNSLDTRENTRRRIA